MNDTKSGMRFSHIYSSLIRLSHLFICVNSSADFLIYYVNGEKFRQAWLETFGFWCCCCCCMCRGGGGGSARAGGGGGSSRKGVTVTGVTAVTADKRTNVANGGSGGSGEEKIALKEINGDFDVVDV